MLIVRDQEMLGGMPGFAGTRVPIQTMLEYLERGLPLEPVIFKQALHLLYESSFWDRIEE